MKEILIVLSAMFVLGQAAIAADVSVTNIVELNDTLSDVTADDTGSLVVGLSNGYASATTEFTGKPCANNDAKAIVPATSSLKISLLLAAKITGDRIILRLRGCEKKYKQFYHVESVSLP